jgi:hypothetical protein
VSSALGLGETSDVSFLTGTSTTSTPNAPRSFSTAQLRVSTTTPANALTSSAVPLSNITTAITTDLPRNNSEITSNRVAPGGIGGTSSSNSQFLVILVLVGMILLVTAVVVVITVYICRKSKIGRGVALATSSVNGFNKPSSSGTDTSTIFYTQTTKSAYSGATIAPSSMGIALPGYMEVSSNSFARIRKLDKGGGGEIYIAQAMTPETSIYGKMLIVKVIGNPGRDITPKMLDAVKQEISILQLMSNNRHFPKFIGYCENPISILMKFYECGSLQSYLKKPLRTIHKLSISNDIAHALFALHLNHIAHCDLKPANVLLERAQDGRLVAILTDFGIARITSDEILAAKSFNMVNLKGLSWHYAAPEVILRFKGAKTRDTSLAVKAGDIYAIAMIIYELLNGIKPW